MTELQTANRFRSGVLARSAWRCVLADETCDGRLEGHHIITQQRLRKLAERGHLTGDLREAIADTRNGIALCRSHHHRVERGSLSLSRDDLPEPIEAFAEDFGCGAELSDRYGRSTDPDRPEATPPARAFGELRQRRGRS